MQNSYRSPNLWNSMTPVVKNLLIINGLMFLADVVLAGQGTNLSRILGAFYFDSPQFAPYQIVTHMFMHGDIMHIFMNMFGLVMFGTMLEERWGAKRFLFFYFAAGLGAIALHMLMNGLQLYNITGSFTNDLSMLRVPLDKVDQVSAIYFAPAIGASGAVFGILTAFAFIFPNTPLFIMFIPVPIKAKYLVIGYIAYELFFGFANVPGDNIARFAHIGGAITGFIIVLIWRKQGKLWGLR